MYNEFITITEAARITGQSDVAIMRLLKDKLQESGLSLDAVMKKEERQHGTVYVISRDFLFKELQEEAQPEDSAPAAPEHADIVEERNANDDLFEAKDKMIDMLQKIVETKDRQMDDLSKKIDELIARDRETNILLKGMQDKLFLLEESQHPVEQKQAEEGFADKKGKK